jgi:hypothetical protein
MSKDDLPAFWLWTTAFVLTGPTFKKGKSINFARKLTMLICADVHLAIYCLIAMPSPASKIPLKLPTSSAFASLPILQG